MKLITILATALPCLFVGQSVCAQTASSLFWRADSTQVKEISAEDNKQYTKIGHHGPAVENSHMALRIYFNNSGAIDVYSKSGKQMELEKYLWYPTEEQQRNEGAGCDEYFVGKTLGLGGIAIWDGEKVVPLEMTAKRVAKVGKTAVGHFAEVASYGILYQNDTVDIAIRVDVLDNSREAIVTARCLSGQKVRFVTGVNFNKDARVKFGKSYISVWGKHQANVSQAPVPIGGGMAFNPEVFTTVEKTENMVRLISEPSQAVNTRVVAASVKESELNTAAKFEKYVIAMKAPRALPILFALTGDSTCTNVKSSNSPQRGWGQLLPFWFEGSGLTVHNYAVSGTSVVTFVHKGFWAKASKDFKPGAFVTVCFGINENYHKKVEGGVDRYASNEAFADSLRSFASQIRAAGATPVFITPLANRRFVDGKFEQEPKRAGKAKVARDVASEIGVYMIDGIEISGKWLESVGDEPSKDFFCWYGPNIYKGPKSVNGKEDNTHLNQYGAYKYSGMLAPEFIKLVPELAPFLKEAKYSEVEAEFGPISIWGIK